MKSKVEFESVDTVRRITLDANKELLRELEEENYKVLENIYNKITNSAKRGAWDLYIRFNDYDIHKSALKTCLLSKGFDIYDNGHCMIVSWLPGKSHF